MRKTLCIVSLILIVLLGGCSPKKIKEFTLGEIGIPDANPNSVEVTLLSITLTNEYEGVIAKEGYDFYITEVLINPIDGYEITLNEQTCIILCYYHVPHINDWVPTYSNISIQTTFNGFDIFQQEITTSIHYVFFFEILKNTMIETPNKEGKIHIITNYGEIPFKFTNTDII